MLTFILDYILIVFLLKKTHTQTDFSKQDFLTHALL